MNVDQFIRRNEASWTRLDALSRQAGRRTRRLSAPELDELVQLYQRSSAQLAYTRVHHRDPALTMRLTGTVAEAHAVLYTAPARPARALVTFFAATFPAAVWRARWFVLVAAVATFAPALAVGTWAATSDEVIESIGDEALREAYIEEDFEAYYSSEPAADFSTKVLVNNIQVSFVAFALGLLFGVGTLAILVYNGINIGVAGGMFHYAGEQEKFWGLILPHGLLELTAVVIAGGAGLAMGWSMIAPGDRTRADALAQEGRRAATMVMGLMLAFGVAALIEGFVTPSGIGTPARVGIGVLVEVVFLLYLVVRGRDALDRESEHDRQREQGLTAAPSP